MTKSLSQTTVKSSGQAFDRYRDGDAEHHGSPGFAGTAPEILVPVLLGATRRLRDRASGVHSKALIAGTPDQVHPLLMDLARSHGTEELIVNVLTHDPADRLRTYQLLAQLLSGGDDDRCAS